MIVIDAEVTDEVSLTVRGHAGYGPVGSDIVCAACTTLGYVIAHAVLEYRDKGLLMQEPVVRMEEGDIEIRCVPNPYITGKLQDVLLYVVETYDLLRRTYPQYLKVTYTAGEDRTI